MYGLPDTNYLRRTMLANNQRPSRAMLTHPLSHTERIQLEVKNAGVSKVGHWKLGTRYLPHIIHPNEHIGGVVYGWNDEGSVMLVATDRRIIYLDKKPLFFDEDEVTYDVVSGVSFSKAGLASTVVLHTRVKDYKVKTFNEKSAGIFIECIEAQVLERDAEKASKLQ